MKSVDQLYKDMICLLEIIHELNEQIQKNEIEKNALITENENLKNRILENSKKSKVKFL